MRNRGDITSHTMSSMYPGTNKLGADDDADIFAGLKSQQFSPSRKM